MVYWDIFFFHDYPHQRLQKGSLLQPLPNNYPLASSKGAHSLIAFSVGQKKGGNLPLILFSDVTMCEMTGLIVGLPTVRLWQRWEVRGSPINLAAFNLTLIEKDKIS